MASHPVEGTSESAATQDRKNVPSTRSIRYLNMSQDNNWDLITALMGGRRTMIAKGQKYLPKQESEDEAPYRVRLSKSFLFEGFNDTVDKLSAKPFSRSVLMLGKFPDAFSTIANDVDKTGKNLTKFSRGLMETGLRRGLTHIFVNFPIQRKNTDEDGESKATIADEAAINARPTFSEISPVNLIDWDENSDGQLIYARWLENAIVRKKDERFVDELRIRIREMDTTQSIVWELQQDENKNPDNENWVKIETTTHTFGEVPIVTFYTEQTGSRTARAPLRKLAEANLEHWQSNSDQTSLLNVARAGILLMTGFTDEDIEDGVTVGPRSQISSTNDAADAKWVEHTGKAIEAGRQNLIDIQNYMTMLGSEPLMLRPGNRTATAEAIDERKNQSAIQAWIRSLESTLDKAFEFAARWLDIEAQVGDNFKTDIFNDFGISSAGKNELEFLLRTRQQRQIRQETFLQELQRRSVLSENVNIEVEVEVTSEEQPPMINMFGDDTDLEEDDDDNNNS